MQLQWPECSCSCACMVLACVSLPAYHIPDPSHALTTLDPCFSLAHLLATSQAHMFYNTHCHSTQEPHLEPPGRPPAPPAATCQQAPGQLGCCFIWQHHVALISTQTPGGQLNQLGNALLTARHKVGHSDANVHRTHSERVVRTSIGCFCSVTLLTQAGDGLLCIQHTTSCPSSCCHHATTINERVSPHRYADGEACYPCKPPPQPLTVSCPPQAPPG
jgi:hypothetical protein